MENMFTENLKKLRNERNLTQGELAQKIEVSRTTIASYEQGWGRPSQKSMVKLAEFFDVSIEYLKGATIPDETKEIVESKNKYFDISNHLNILISIMEDEERIIKIKEEELAENKREYIKDSLKLMQTILEKL
ncbi:helix-turn-helix domain-containing protein [Senegalia massiliensis]|nr:helix-turn-helix transcriptional regulator [Senegalia massiliensis]